MSNQLTAAALVVEPRLAAWRDMLGAATGAVPHLAGSGSTWFAEGTLESLGLTGRDELEWGAERARSTKLRRYRAAGSADGAVNVQIPPSRAGSVAICATCPPGVASGWPSASLCFFLRMRLRRFLMRIPWSAPG